MKFIIQDDDQNETNIYKDSYAVTHQTEKEESWSVIPTRFIETWKKKHWNCWNIIHCFRVKKRLYCFKGKQLFSNDKSSVFALFSKTKNQLSKDFQAANQCAFQHKNKGGIFQLHEYYLF